MARGSYEKELITNTILKIFKNSFINDKEIRIPVMSAEGEEIQIKVTLTAAKTNIETGISAADSNIEQLDIVDINPLTDEEKDELIKKLEKLCPIAFE